jgi:hypothetical protein
MVLVGCSSPGESISPARATELLPTWIAQTIQARQIPFLTGEVTPSPGSFESTPQAVDNTPASTPTVAELVLSSSTPNILIEVTSTPSGRPTRTPTITPTPTIPNAAIQVNEPGPLSRIISPLVVRAWVIPGGDGRVRLELYGEDGRLLVRKILRYGADNHQFFLDETLEFEIPGVAETGRLQISTYDTYGRLVDLSTQDIILLSIGDNQINPPGALSEPVIVQEPSPNKLIQGETVLISGMVRTFHNQDLLVELIDRNGQVVGYRQAFIPEGIEGVYTPFLVEVPFKVDSVTNVRITIKKFSSGRIGGLIYASSQEILLSP